MENKLEQKANIYKQLIKTQQDKYGFIQFKHCDSLLFSGLVGSVPDIEIQIEAAKDDSGRWLRRPKENPCFDCDTKTKQGSHSSISRDMLLGLAWFAWHNKRLDISESVIKYALSNWGFMGEAESTKEKWGSCQILPGLFSTFCWISYKLGGPKRYWALWIPADPGNKDTEGFAAHLQVLHILLRRDIAGFDLGTRCLEYHAKRQPNNPLFQIAVGNTKKAKEILLRKDLWPADRLPTKADRFVEWIPMRDEGSDWEPDGKITDIHSGGDYLFLHWLANE